jgi:5'-nucleotidase
METSKVFWAGGMPVGVIGSVVRNTPELVKPGNTAGLQFLDEAERIERESARLRRWGVKIQVVVIHEGATAGANRVDGNPAAPWSGPIIGIVDQLQNTTVDLVIAGHTHRPVFESRPHAATSPNATASQRFHVAPAIVSSSSCAPPGR